MIATKVRQLSDGEELVLVEELGNSRLPEGDLQESLFDRKGRELGGDRGPGARRERRPRPIADREEI